MRYQVKMRLSHSEHVPRYQLHVVQSGKSKQWIVGHMEKTETHLRAKPGEFIRVQVWKLTANSMVLERRRSALQRKSNPVSNAVKFRPTPSATDMLMMGMTIATQAKLDPKIRAGEDSEVLFDRDSERWVQTVGVDNKAYSVTVERKDVFGKGGHKSMKSMNMLRIFHGINDKGDPKRVCTARKQRFNGAIGKVEQPYLGVQVRPEQRSSDPEETAGETSVLPSMLDTHGLMLLLLCLAWSEDTMSPQRDMTDRFVQAMRAERGDPGSAEEIGLSVQWDTEDVRLRLKHIPYAAIHQWEGRASVHDLEAGVGDDDDH